MDDKIIYILIGSFFTFILNETKTYLSKRKEIREAASALRFEIQSNLFWLDDIINSMNYLRDEAWVIMKNKGYISFLPNPIPINIIQIYDLLHKINDQIWIKKENKNEKLEFNIFETQENIEKLKLLCLGTNEIFDKKFKTISKNFK